MKLNPECIRDILIAVEANTDSENSMEFSKEVLTSPIDKYDYNTVLYHIRQCHKANLIDSVTYYDNGEWGYIGDLSPEGHRFIADVRSDTVWHKVLSICGKIGTTSLPAIVQISSNVITAIIKAEFGLL